jgi:thymidylate synthase (FAD)
LASDLSVVNAARVSFGIQKSKLEPQDEYLILYLMRNRHGTPFEHNHFRFRVKVPIFVAREHYRHRAGHSYNELSGRYKELPSEFFMPERMRSQKGKPGAYTFEDLPYDRTHERLRDEIGRAYRTSWEVYQELLLSGVAKEQARMVLPVGIFTEYIWSCNARSLMHFLSLRGSPDAMKEIQLVAEQAEATLADKMPATWAAWNGCGRIAP